MTNPFDSDANPICCRAANEQDEPFLRRLLMATLTEELAAWAWPETVRDPLLEMQYRVRRSGMESLYPGAEINIVCLERQPVGWVVLLRTGSEIHIVDIALLPEQRGKGVGTAVLRGLLDEADRNGLPIRLNVNIGNRAIHLYERLGFRQNGGTEVQYYMQRPAGSPVTSEAEKFPEAR